MVLKSTVIIDDATIKELKGLQDKLCFSTSTIIGHIGIATNTWIRAISGQTISLKTTRKLKAFLREHGK